MDRRKTVSLRGINKKSIMRTLELNAYKNELAREILAIDNMDVLESVHRAYLRAMNKVAALTKKEEIAPYTMEELNARLDEAEAEPGGTSSEIFFSQMENEMPWLCK